MRQVPASHSACCLRPPIHIISDALSAPCLQDTTFDSTTLQAFLNLPDPLLLKNIELVLAGQVSGKFLTWATIGKHDLTKYAVIPRNGKRYPVPMLFKYLNELAG